MNIAIILAGGVGSRVGGNLPKQFIDVYGKPIIAYTIELFENRDDIDIIEIGCHPDYITDLNNLIKKMNYKKIKYIVSGGDTFQQTVLNCVENLNNKIKDDDICLIHYAAAPFTSKKIIDDAIKVCEMQGNAVSMTPCFQLMGTNDGKVSKKWVDRDQYVQIACPQCLNYKLLKDIYHLSKEKGLLNKIEPHITSLAYALNIDLYKSYGDQTNIKITTKEDVELFKGWVLRQNELKAMPQTQGN